MLKSITYPSLHRTSPHLVFAHCREEMWAAAFDLKSAPPSSVTDVPLKALRRCHLLLLQLIHLLLGLVKQVFVVKLLLCRLRQRLECNLCLLQLAGEFVDLLLKGVPLFGLHLHLHFELYLRD